MYTYIHPSMHHHVSFCLIDCPFSKLSGCFDEMFAYGNVLPWQRDQSGDIKDINIDAACAYSVTKQCYVTASSACSSNNSDRLVFDVLESIYDYVCTPEGKQGWFSSFRISQ